MCLKKETKLIIIIVSSVCALILSTLAFIALFLVPNLLSSIPSFNNGGIKASLTAINADGNKPSKIQFDVAQKILTYRLTQKGIYGAKITFNESESSMEIDVPLLKKQTNSELSAALNQVIRVSYLTLQEIDENKKDYAGEYLPTGKIVVDGMDVKEADAVSEKDGTVIIIGLTEDAGKKFEEATSRLRGKRLGIFLDEQLISAPLIQDRIPGGQFVITGNRSAKEAAELARIIKSGPLPFKLQVKEITSIAPFSK